MIKKCLLVMGGALLLNSSLVLATNEKAGGELADEFSAVISVATGVVGDMQKEINSSTLSTDKLTPAAVSSAFNAKYQAKAGKAFDVGVGGQIGDFRAKAVKAIQTVIDENKAYMIGGGQDAFVPAYFRALVLTKINQSMGKTVQGYVTNVDANLINGDSAVGVVFGGSPLKAEVQKLVDAREMNAVNKVVSGHLMSYRPMKLEESCVACHKRNGIEQKVGEFGGALVVDIQL